MNGQNGETTEDINNLNVGTYEVQIENEAGCVSTETFMVDGPPPLVAEPVLTLPTCMGGLDGAIVINASGGTPGYEYDWGSGFVSENNLSQLGVGLYTVIVRDANGCTIQEEIDLRELELVLNNNVPAVTAPRCYNTFDGSISLDVANGQGPYEFDWNDGNGFVTRNNLAGLNSGVFNIIYRDANGCLGDTSIAIVAPDPIDLQIQGLSLSCFESMDGEAIPSVSGGTPPYQFTWSNGVVDSVNGGLEAGQYMLTITDGNGCDTTGTVSIDQPTEGRTRGTGCGGPHLFWRYLRKFCGRGEWRDSPL